MDNPTRPGLHIHRINAVAAHADGRKILVRADALLKEERTELEIAVTTDLAPVMALALLASTADARAERDELEPALDVLAAAVVRSSTKERVRLQLLFDKGVVLPFELTVEAGRALAAGLEEYLQSPAPRYAENRRPPLASAGELAAPAQAATTLTEGQRAG